MVPVEGSSGSTARTQFLFAKAKAKETSARENKVRYGEKANVVKNQERLPKS